MPITLWKEAVETPPYPTFELLKAKGGEETFCLSKIPGEPVQAREKIADEGELLRDADLKFLPNWSSNLAYRGEVMANCNNSDQYCQHQLVWSKSNILYWMNTFMWSHEPRGEDVRTVPFVTFPIQDVMITKVLEWLRFKRTGTVEKSRDMGASWIMMGIFVWLGIFFPGILSYVLSMAEKYVDNKQVTSLMGKMRFILISLPAWMRGGWESNVQDIDKRMSIVFPDTDSLTEGELSGGQAGRSGRGKIAFYDEFSYMEDTERVRAAAASLASTSVFLWTANGMGNEAYKMKEDPNIETVTMHWSEHPLKNPDWATLERLKLTRSGWAREHEIDYSESTENKVFPEFISYTTNPYDWCHVQKDDYYAYDDHFDVILAVDIGIGDPTSLVFLQEKPAPLHFEAFTKKCLIAFAEMEATDKKIDIWAETIKNQNYRYSEIICDYRSAKARDWVKLTWLDYMNQHGLFPVGRRNSEEAPREELGRLLRTPGAFAIYKKGCPNLIKGFQNWSFPVNRQTGTVPHGAQPKHDQFSHRMKALCYAVDWRYGKKELSRRKETLRWDFPVLTHRSL